MFYPYCSNLVKKTIFFLNDVKCALGVCDPGSLVLYDYDYDYEFNCSINEGSKYLHTYFSGQNQMSSFE